jgi:hypothetical protein
MNNGMNIASVTLKSVLSESRRRREDRKMASGPDATSTVNGTFASRRTDPRRARKVRGGRWQDPCSRNLNRSRNPKAGRGQCPASDLEWPQLAPPGLQGSINLKLCLANLKKVPLATGASAQAASGQVRHDAGPAGVAKAGLGLGPAPAPTRSRASRRNRPGPAPSCRGPGPG